MKPRVRWACAASVLALFAILGPAALGCATARPPDARAGSAPQQREEPKTCRDNRECREGEYCAKPEGRCEEEGTCSARPEVCAQIWDPVCGCDGKTYSSACHAALAGVSVKSDGECRDEPATGDGTLAVAAAGSEIAAAPRFESAIGEDPPTGRGRFAIVRGGNDRGHGRPAARPYGGCCRGG